MQYPDSQQIASQSQEGAGWKWFCEDTIIVAGWSVSIQLEIGAVRNFVTHEKVFLIDVFGALVVDRIASQSGGSLVVFVQ